MKTTWKCPVCSKKKINKILTATHTHGRVTLSNSEKFKYFQCAHCQSVYLQSLKIDAHYYKKYYALERANGKVGVMAFIEKCITAYSQMRKESIVRSAIENKKTKTLILDVGCGTGEFLQGLDETKYDKYGIELNKEDYLISKRKGLTVYHEDILKKNFHGKKFDVITLWHVFEHIPDPGLLLRKLRTILSNDGIIIIATPNIQSLGFSMAQTAWFHFDAPRHIILFSEKGVKIISEKNRLAVQKVVCETFEFPLDLLWSIKNSQGNRTPFSFLEYPILKIRARETLTYVIKKQQ